MSLKSPKFAPFFTFHGNANEALEFYANILPGAKILEKNLFQEGQMGDPGKLMTGILEFFDNQIMFMDMQMSYECPSFTWACSFLFTLTDADVYEKTLRGLADGGFIMMEQAPFMDYQKVAWVTDRFGVTWQPVLLSPDHQEKDSKEQQEKVETKSKPAKAVHRWSKQVAEIDFFVDYMGSKATVRWIKRNEMLIKKGAILVAETPLNKDGTVGFAAKFTHQLRLLHADKIVDFVTTDDIILKSVNEVGNFLYFAGTNSWLVLKDKNGKTIDEYTVVE